MKHGRSGYTYKGCRCDICTSAKVEYARSWHQKNKVESQARRTRRRIERRAFYLEEMGGVCVTCGTSADLQFDHIDPASKQYKIAEMLPGHSKELLEKELAKCQLLCITCHGKKSWASTLERSA